MKYPQSVPMPRVPDVEDWLGGELEARGIDAVVYTRYILSLMLQDYEHDSIQHPKRIWSGGEAQTNWPSWDANSLKRLAVLQCLMSATAQKCEMESLVDELSVKLQDVRSGAAVTRPGIHPSEFYPFSDYNKAFPPLKKDVGLCYADGGRPAWARGILHASLTANPYHDFGIPDYFPLTHKTTLGNTLDIYGPRLYERSANRSLERVMAGLDATFHQFWNPKDDVERNCEDQNYTYFQNQPYQLPSTLFLNDKEMPQTQWSLGGNDIEDVTSEVPIPPAAEAIPVPVPVPVPAGDPEEDLLTSARTHFRPIRSDDSGQTRVYEDGTTFDISNAIDQLDFQRSESGTLFLETGKYMEFKSEDDGDTVEEFVPKFRVQQSNEKFCQTDDLDLMAEPVVHIEHALSSPEIQEEENEFYFPGDDELALDLSSDEQHEGEVVEIVSGRLNVRWKGATVLSPSLECEVSDHEWDAEDEAMVDDLVDSPSWDGGDPGQSCWPLSDSIWNPKTSSCDTCQSGMKVESVDPLKQEWSEIWKPPCASCAGDKTADDWPKLGATLSAYLRESRAKAVDLLSVWGPGFNSNHGSLSESDGLRDIWSSAASEDGAPSLEIWSPITEAKPEDVIRTNSLLRDELCRDGDKLLSDLSCLHLQQIDDSEKTEASDILDEEEYRDDFPTSPPSPVADDKGPSFVSLWATWDIIAIGDDISTFDERTETAQNERKRRHSSSLRMCELYLDGECRRAHCRFRHDMTSPVQETLCVNATQHARPYGRELNRAFTF